MIIKYDDWRDNINPNLLRRYWISKNSPNHFLCQTRYGITLIEYVISFIDNKPIGRFIYIGSRIDINNINTNWNE